MFRDSAETAGRDLFACTEGEWLFLQELGRTFGWRALGTTYLVPSRLKIPEPAHRDYRGGEMGDVKTVSHNDAIAWARALDASKDSPHFGAMLDAQAAIAATDADSLRNFIAEFVEYAYGGSFTFFATA